MKHISRFLVRLWCYHEYRGCWTSATKTTCLRCGKTFRAGV